MLLYGSISMWIAMCLVIWYNRHQKNASIYLALLLMTMGFHGVSHAILLSPKLGHLVPFFYNIWHPLYVLPGPLLFFYLRASLTNSISLKKADLLHFIPFALLFVDAAPYWVSSLSHKQAVAAAVIGNPNQILQLNLNWFIPAKMNMALRPILMICYSLLCFAMVFGTIDPKITLSKKLRHLASWHGIVCLTILLVGISYLITLIKLNNLVQPKADTSYFVFRSAYHEIGAMIFIALPVFLNFFPKILYGIDYVANLKESASESLAPINEEPLSDEEEQKLSELAIQIEQYLAESKAYLNPRFSLDELSRSLGVPRHQLYKCMAKVMKVKFTDLRMQLRIEHAKKLLSSGMADAKKLEAISLESGFASRSNFHIAFKSLTGLTPTEYLEQLSEKE